MPSLRLRFPALCCSWMLCLAASQAAPVTGRVVEADSDQLLPARVYMQGPGGKWHFPASADPAGSAIRYERGNFQDRTQSESYTTLSAHPFKLDLPPGDYDVTVERGKEYFPLTLKLEVVEGENRWRLPLNRWVGMAGRGWYSGDTHCHRHPSEVPNSILAEDLNVCLPLTYWTTEATRTARDGDKNAPGDFPAEAIVVDPTHVWYPRNTEYEIFSVGGKRHTLGAFLVLNHKTPFDLPALPMREVARKARAEGALIDLEKHNWEWAFIAAPILPVDLFELGNNHNWRIPFGIRDWGVAAAEWMDVRGSLTIVNERDWINYGWETYYGLLNCGLRIQPTAGTANGVHPVPLGHSRVYVNLPGGFSYDAWMAGLKAGRSFVTTGPMLLATVNGRPPGEVFGGSAAGEEVRVAGEVRSMGPLARLELVVNGVLVKSLPVAGRRDGSGAQVTPIEAGVRLEGSSWVVVRCFEAGDSPGVRFAHSAPWFFDVGGEPVRPRRQEVAYFIRRVEEEIVRNTGVLSEDQLGEYRAALAFWKQKAEQAR